MQQVQRERGSAVQLGGLFSVYNADGSRNEAQAQALAAFLMAVNEVNMNATILPNNKVEIAILDAQGLINATLIAIHLATQSFGTGGKDSIHAVLCPLISSNICGGWRLSGL